LNQVAIDQPLAFQARLDPVGGEEIEAFDIVDIVFIEELMRVFGRFHRRAIARQHVEMRGPRKRLDRRLETQKGRAHEAPLAPAAFHAAMGKGDPGPVLERVMDAVIGLGGRAGVEMDRDAIARFRQALGLSDDRLGVLVAQENEGNLGHTRRGSAQVSFIIALAVAHGD
jgi:hypothetical protein